MCIPKVLLERQIGSFPHFRRPVTPEAVVSSHITPATFSQLIRRVKGSPLVGSAKLAEPLANQVFPTHSHP